METKIKESQDRDKTKTIEACLFRYNVLSLVYFLYLLLLPWFLCPNKHTIKGPGGGVSAGTRAKQLAERLKSKACRVLRDLGRILAIGLLALAGITLPSAFSAIYFLLFVGVCTWWACHLPISHLGFNALCVMVGFFTAGHMVCLYVYQSSLSQAVFPPASLWARLFGLKDIVLSGNCTSPFQLSLNSDHDWPVYANPGVLFLLYVTITTVLKTGYIGAAKQEEEQKADRGAESPEDEEMSEFRTWTEPTDGCRDDTQLMLLSLGNEGPKEVTLASEENTELGAEAAPIVGKSESPFFLLGRVVMQQSYVCALIAMMVWSITYHSWLTFVLLLWACLIWILRARRHAATLCSPFILLYGLALCCLQYVWAMELQPELPSTVGNMSLRQLVWSGRSSPVCGSGSAPVHSDLLAAVATVGEGKLQPEKEPDGPITGSHHRRRWFRQRVGAESPGGMVMCCYAKY
ncbi:hypothetical protein WMY93_018235 [Mugilogobius chulae]|uniref:Piezo TM1-24 domain-containing protein n=1 Tax=Mugilogobius chulae TaxID=88201 RepID=A0AAW0NQ38_9GOBI